MNPAARLASLGATLIPIVLLLGCQTAGNPERKDELRGTINVLVSLDGTESFSKGKLEEQAALAREIAVDYGYLNPEVHVQIELTREGDLIEQVKRRNNDGLSPDLILASGRSARKLHEKGLTDSVAIDQGYAKDINPGLFQRLRIDNHTLVGVPVFLVPQLACYNRKRIAHPPERLDPLLAASDQGVEIGMALDMVDLFWTVGAWGGPAAVNASPSRHAITPAEQKAVLTWLQSLLDASKHLKVNFYDHQEDLIVGLSNGRLDWITCRSSNLGRLRRRLGEALGVGPLPAGPAGAPTPVTVAKVWAFGKSSSPNQRRLADRFVRFSINTIMQRYTALLTEQMLPANQRIPIPTGSSKALQAMLTSLQQSQASGILKSAKSSDQQLKEVTAIVRQMIYGEVTPEKATKLILGGIQ